jgi:hypothetical protein
MKSYWKATGATALTVVPVLIKQYSPPDASNIFLILYVVAVFLGSLKLFQPDRRFLLVRNPTLDAAFEKIFQQARNQLTNGERLPFRVHVMQPRGFGRWKKLVVVYSFGSAPTDPDHGKTWSSGCGLCWRVYSTGKLAWYRKGEHSIAEYGIKNADAEATDHVKAVLCLPIRKPARVYPEKVSAKVVGVLAFDALTDDGANGLAEFLKGFTTNNNGGILDTVEYVSLYF